MEFTINTEVFYMEADAAGMWFWSSRRIEAEASFPTAYECQQDALNTIQAEIANEQQELAQRLEDECFGTYSQQVEREYNYAIRH